MNTQHRAQLAPALNDPNYIMRRGRVVKLREYFRTLLPADRATLLLDLGGGTSPYETLAAGKPVRWLSADRRAFPNTKVVCDVGDLPFADNSLDRVLCLQVLELLPDMARAVAEMRRVLKPGGWAIVSNPAVYPPFGDARWRILSDGYGTLFQSFSACEVDAECNTAASFFRTMNVYLDILLQDVPLVGGLWRVTLCPLSNLVGWWANTRFRDVGFAANYIVRAQK